MDGSPDHPSSTESRRYPRRYGNFHLRRQGEVPVATPSPNWKESLRQSCLERAKQRRLDLVRRKRQQHDHGSNSFNNFMEATKESVEPYGNEEGQDARVLVEEELRELGVAMNLDENGGDRNGFTSDESRHIDFNGMTTIATPKQSLVCDWDSENFISEEEIYDLMQEVEEMLNRDEESLMEEVLESERMEKQQFEDQIADYERWAECNDNVDDGDISCRDEFIPCPICQGGLITSTDSGDELFFVCNNNRNATCRLQVASQGFSLQQLFDQFRNVYDTHGLECPELLTFGVENSLSGKTKLVAKCNCCNLNATVL